MAERLACCGSAEEHLEGLGWAFEDAEEARIAQDLRGDVGLDVPAAAERLYEGVGGGPEEFGAGDLAGDKGFGGNGLSGIDLLGDAPDQRLDGGGCASDGAEAHEGCGIVDQPPGG